MTQHAASPSIELVPETAPFTPEQRSWLNGFFAGLVSLDGAGITALSREQNAALMPPAQNEFGDADDGEAPWHDPSLPLAERLTLAEDRPVRRRLMAAMAQQDCGQCGYSCEDYSNSVPENGSKAQSLRAGRQGNRSHAEGAGAGDRSARSAEDADGQCNCFGCDFRRRRSAGDGGWTLARNAR